MSENTIEIEADTVKSAWDLIKDGDFSHKRILWNFQFFENMNLPPTVDTPAH